MSRAPPGDGPGRHTGFRTAPHSSGAHRSRVSEWERTEDVLRTAQGGGRGFLQGVKEAGGSALPAEKGAEEQMSPSLADGEPLACPGVCWQRCPQVSTSCGFSPPS